ncbi:MAG: DUF2634 domain-containing protein [Acidaminococcus intestini]|jgi:phage baseplate assembly protein W|uniref:DUF2634 domain-containing protein n=1 Tax=Acidaminococcus intestini TaxID=187327 RepID=UPI001D05FF61|nr:DUF2634 domain-containing protein [Acidaminococcus intestini]MCB7082015.1 DUF2634 domain-containing protein [Acidaminococcus intestini]DAY91257.1 MAG TPA: Protein of unknown function (DUF2634) [Caudoviricetes sp.]
MALVPDASLNVGGAVVEVQTAEKWPSKTYVMNIDGERITGTMTDDIEAVKQAIYKILNTERYQYPIYSWNYGVELADLFGKPIAYVLPEIPRRIKEALVADDRIIDATAFELSHDKRGNVLAKFKVITIFGNFDAGKEVRI